MRVYQSQLLNQPIHQGKKLLGRLRGIGVDYATGKVKWAYFKFKACAAADIISWQELELRLGAEIQKTNKMTGRLKRQKVLTQAGKYLGRVVDFQFDTEQLMLTQLNVREKWTFSQLLKQNYRLISYHQIYKIDHKQVVIFDEFETVIEKTAQPLGATLS